MQLNGTGRTVPRLAASLGVLVCLLAAPAPLVAAASAADLYATLLSEEHHLRRPGVTPTLHRIRRLVTRYETLVDRIPDSPLREHALWHAADLTATAYELYRALPDRERSVQLLDRLTRDHPDGVFAERIGTVRARLTELARVAWIHEVTHDAATDRVRVVVTLDRDASFAARALPTSDLFYLDITGAHPALPLRGARLPVASRHVREIRLGRFPGDITRVVVYTHGPPACRATGQGSPSRIVIDCWSSPARLSRADDASPPHSPEPHSGGGSTVPPIGPHPVLTTARAVEDPPLIERRLDPIPAGGRPDASETTAPAYSLARQLGLGVSRVVIDAGHGGHDPGARAGSITEAEVVLDIALRLEQRLTRMDPPVTVILTRPDDRYVSLEGRATLANEAGGDLLVSIHANASENPTARGVETYSLNLATDTHAQAIAARENQMAEGTMRDLQPWLERMATSSTLDESAQLAATVQASLIRTLRTHAPDVPDLGVKHAPFVVLLRADMPSILTEVSFLTNDREAALLATGAYRDLVAEALFEGIARYRRSLTGRSPGLVTAADGL